MYRKGHEKRSRFEQSRDSKTLGVRKCSSVYCSQTTATWSSWTAARCIYSSSDNWVHLLFCGLTSWNPRTSIYTDTRCPNCCISEIRNQSCTTIVTADIHEHVAQGNLNVREKPLETLVEKLSSIIYSTGALKYIESLYKLSRATTFFTYFQSYGPPSINFK